MAHSMSDEKAKSELYLKLTSWTYHNIDFSPKTQLPRINLPPK